jgi:hypothetical protein
MTMSTAVEIRPVSHINLPMVEEKATTNLERLPKAPQVN